MKAKTADLSGPALNWAVATLMGYANLHTSGHRDSLGVLMMDPPRMEYGAVDFSALNFTYNWFQGGPIIEQEGIALWLSAEPEKGLWAAADKRWMDLPADSDEFMTLPDPWHGPTPLIAAMRCFVASKLGDEVDVPEELL